MLTPARFPVEPENANVNAGTFSGFPENANVSAGTFSGFPENVNQTPGRFPYTMESAAGIPKPHFYLIYRYRMMIIRSHRI
jgi:hypothetical protein